MANFSYTVDSHFSPFTMQEMLVPFTAYKDAFEKTEEAYNALSDSDKFKYLSQTLPEGSTARQIYEGYANDLQKYATDLSKNGLTMSNRSGLTNMKRRYTGEIGRLVQADEALREEKKLRQSLNAQDSSRLYATDNLNIDNFLDGNTPNLYNVSGNELYARGAQAAKAYSSRIFDTGAGGTTLGGYYIDWIQRNGVSPDSIATFRKNVSAIPELAADVDAILKEKGVTQNLTGYNLERARESVINGMIDGAIYQEQHSPQRDLGKLDAATSAQIALSNKQLKMQAAASGMTENEDGSFTYNVDNDPSYQKAIEVAKIQAGRRTSRGTNGTSGTTTSKIKLKTGKVLINTDGKLKNVTNYSGASVTYNELPDEVKRAARARDPQYYNYYSYYKDGNSYYMANESNTVDTSVVQPSAASTASFGTSGAAQAGNQLGNQLGYMGAQ